MKKQIAKMNAANMAVLYIRVSTEEQNLGPEAQRAALERYAAAHGIQIVAIFEDRLSGATQPADRPGLLAALDAIAQHGAGTLLVAKRDRLARDPMISAMIESLTERRGARVASAAGEGNGDGAGDVLMRRLVDAFAEYERAMIRSRTSAALQAKKARGERLGAAPFGWRSVGGKLVRDDAEQATIARARELRDSGAKLELVAATLTAEGCARRARGERTAAGWTAGTVHALLARCEAA